jgi:hypothetical protein
MAEAPVIEAAGGCLCGAVRYRISGTPMNITHCHCTMCRRASGAPVVTWLTVAPSAFAFTQGAARIYRSSPRAARGFCAGCGTPLTFVADKVAATEIDITVASLDDPAAFPPRKHIYAESRIPWFTCDPQLPSQVGSSSA